ncbi:hypothetical protein [Halorientalis pallida]|uniref:hypothetical protein n=1 Tax=Halorientalis pallida TaxID=2479928 RepID=UPI00187D64AC|nr:hypothetical protein [Halorientalis pallida]
MLQHKPTPGTERLESDRDTVSTHVTTCPTCDASVVDGQGLLTCTDCDWAGLVG